MCAPGSEARVAHDCAVAGLEILYIGARGQHLDHAFVAGDGGGFGGAEGSCERRFGGVDTFDLRGGGVRKAISGLGGGLTWLMSAGLIGAARNLTVISSP